MLVEGSIGRRVALEKGEDWAKGCSVNSLVSLVEYVRVCTKQDADWSIRATNTLLGLVKEPVCSPLTWIRFDILISLQGVLENLVRLVDDVICSSFSPAWDSLREIVERAHLYKRIRSLKDLEAPGVDEEYELDYFEDCDEALYNVKVIVQPDNIIECVSFLSQCRRIEYNNGVG